MPSRGHSTRSRLVSRSRRPATSTSAVGVDGSSIGLDELVEGARARIAVGPEAPEPSRVAEAAVVGLLVSDLADEVRAQRDPVLRHARRPAAGRALQAAERAALEQETMLPRVALERRDQRPQGVEQLGAAGATER